MNEREVIVTGGRAYKDAAAVARVLGLLSPTRIIQGGADGADALAAGWASSHGIPVTEYPANWDEHGKAAGPIRNMEMVCGHPRAIVVAFPGGRGTADCVKQARLQGLIVLVVQP